MFLSSPYEKGGGGTSEISSSARGGTLVNTSPQHRFPPGGIQTSLGEESQNVRIQLAVHRYNNTLGSSQCGRRSLISPVRHGFFKNSHKGKGKSDGDTGDHYQTSKCEKRHENRYEGVGNFPTVHLKKSSVLYRPIRRLKEVKVPYPEFPVNRLLNHHLAEFSTDSKNSPRSVLDVLQDMSRKRVHSNDEIEYARYGSRGLGGDLPVNEETLCRPLFVQKPKVNAVLTRDSTTQTFSPHHQSDTSSVASSVSSTKQDSNDPRAELRRKLAKQNNEIFASLSSSLTSKFAMKRKLDNVSASKDERRRSDSSSAVKKTKFNDNQSPSSSGGNRTNKIVNGVQGNSSDSAVATRSGVPASKVTRNGKVGESAATSPNKDRLTTIYLDMESSTSPKAQMFQGSFTGNDRKEPTNDLNGSLESKNDYSAANGTQFNFTATSPKSSLNSPLEKDSKKLENDGSIHPVISNSQSDTNSANSTSEQFKLNTSNSVTFNFNGATTGWSPTKLPTTIGSASSTSTATTTTTTSSAGDSNATNHNKQFTITSGINVQFGMPQTAATQSLASSITSTTTTNAGAGDMKKVDATVTTTGFTIPTTTTATTSQLTFGFGSGTSSIAVSSSSPVTFSMPSSAITTSSALISSSSAVSSLPNKPVFSFGQTTAIPTTATANLPSLQTSENQPASVTSILTTSKPEVSKNEFSWKIPTSSTANFTFSSGSSTTTTSALGAASMFTFGQKPTGGESSAKEEKIALEGGQLKNSSFTIQPEKTGNSEPAKSVFPALGVPSVTSSTSQPNIQSGFNNPSSLFSNSTTTTNTTIGQGDKNTSFGISSIGQKSSPVASETTAKASEPATSQPAMTCTFGQSSGTALGSGSTENASEQSTQPKVFSFGQTPVSQSSFSGGGFGAATTTTGTFTFGTKATSVSSFGQNVSKTDAGATVNFGKNTTQSTVTSQIGEVPPTFGSSSSSSSVPKVATTFDAKPGGIFGSVPTTSIFGRPPSSSSSSTTTLFGQNSTSIPSTGTTLTAPTTSSLTTFGTSTPATTTPFGGSAFQTTSTFGIPSTTQSTITFGAAKSTPATISFGNSSGGFSSVTTTASIGGSTIFGAPTTGQSGFTLNSTSSSMTPFEQSFATQNKPTATTLTSTSTSIFNTGNSGPTTSFNTTGNQNVFGAKTTTSQGGIFGQDINKTPAPAFGAQNKPFAFGQAATTVTNGFQAASAPKTTGSSVFTFGASTPSSGSAFNFGSNTGTTTGSSNASTPFNFSSQTNTTFKFGSSTGKEGSGFGTGTPSATFTFGAQQNNNNNSTGNSSNTNQNPLDSNPSTSGMFNFGSNQPQSSSGFNFGSNTPSAVFSFGSSGSGSSSGSTFNFGTPQAGGPFGQATPSPGFSAPGTFSIGSGSSSSQSRPRASSRLRRRP